MHRWNPADPPQQIMLGFHTVFGWKEVYWGPNLLQSTGMNGGDLPPTGQWVRLEAHAGDIPIDWLDVDGMSSFFMGEGRNGIVLGF